eukprot:SAG11_NODE_2191_length_3706_cov_2.096756_7_plen_87_part_00
MRLFADSAEANPPFDEASVVSCFVQINSLLLKAAEAEDGDPAPLLFVIVTPFIPEPPWKSVDQRLMRSSIDGVLAFSLHRLPIVFL